MGLAHQSIVFDLLEERHFGPDGLQESFVDFFFLADDVFGLAVVEVLDEGFLAQGLFLELSGLYENPVSLFGAGCGAVFEVGLPVRAKTF